MGCKVVSLSIQKGGSAKTTTSHCMAECLGELGYKVLLVDFDPQANNTFWCGLEKIGYISGMDVLLGNADITDAIEHYEKFDLLIGSSETGTASTRFTSLGKERLLKKALAPIKENYDFIIIDTPPAMDVITLNALTASDYVIIPMEAGSFSLQGIGGLQTALDDVKEYTNPDIKLLGILLTRAENRTNLSKNIKSALKEIVEVLNTKVFETIIRESVVVGASQLDRVSLYDYAPKSNPALDYKEFVDEFLWEIKHNG